MSGLATRARNFAALVAATTAAVAGLAAYSVVSPRFRSGTEWYRAQSVTLLASSVKANQVYVRFQVTSTTRGVLEGNQPHGQYMPAPFSRTYVLHPKEKLTIQFTAGVNDIGNVVSCFVQTNRGNAAQDQHVKQKNTRGDTPNDVNCNTSVVNI